VLDQRAQSVKVSRLSCHFVVHFTYSALGPFSATLSLTSKDAAGGAFAPATLAITGTGVAPLSWSPSPLALGNVVVGDSEGVTETLTVTNLISQAITLRALSVGYAANTKGVSDLRYTVLQGSTCQVGTVLDGGVSCQFIVLITYSALGPFSATLSLTSRDASGGALATAILPITGTGIQ
jgi:hypothetical protein